MRTTVDIADELFRRAKAEAALRGRKFRDLVEEGLRRVLDDPSSGAPPPAAFLADLMKGAKGVVDSGVPDLASNPKHMEGFGDGSGNH